MQNIDSYDHQDIQLPATTAMLEGLSAGNLYKIRLSSVNEKGASEPGPPTVIFVGVAG